MEIQLFTLVLSVAPFKGIGRADYRCTALSTEWKPPVTLSRSGHCLPVLLLKLKWPLRLSVIGGFWSVSRAIHLKLLCQSPSKGQQTSPMYTVGLL